MRIPRSYRWLLAAATPLLSFDAVAQDAPPAGEVRATPVVDARGEYERAPIVQRGPGQAAPAQRAYIDPKTRKLIDRPADADPVVAPKGAREVDYTVRATPEGYLYIDTSNLAVVSRATLGDDGRVEVSCGLDHDHAEDAK